MKLLQTNNTGSAQTTQAVQTLKIENVYNHKDEYVIYGSAQQTIPTDEWALVTYQSPVSAKNCPEGIYHNGQNVVCGGRPLTFSASNINVTYVSNSKYTVTPLISMYNPSLDSYIFSFDISGTQNTDETWSFHFVCNLHNWADEYNATGSIIPIGTVNKTGTTGSAAFEYCFNPYFKIVDENTAYIAADVGIYLRPGTASSAQSPTHLDIVVQVVPRYATT